MAKYETRIDELQKENTRLKTELESLKVSATQKSQQTSASTTVQPTTPAKDTSIGMPATLSGKTLSNLLNYTFTGQVLTTAGMPLVSTKSDMYKKLIEKSMRHLPSLIQEYGLSADSSIGLFEFVEPNGFFISVDDGKNPVGVTAFKMKFLFHYDTDLNLSKSGVFDLDYGVSRYVTVFGSNPYSKASRIVLRSPAYSGNLFSIVATSTGTTSSGTTNSVVTQPAKSPASTVAQQLVDPSTVTYVQIKAAYDKNKPQEAIRLSDLFLQANSPTKDILNVRYRSYFILQKYQLALDEIAKLETIVGTLDSRSACDASSVARIAKKQDLVDKYSKICVRK